MQEIYLRKLAHWLLSFIIESTPALVRPWGEAMLTELPYVRGGWAALSWAVGGAGVLLVQTFLSLFTRPNLARTVLPAPSVNVTEDTMRKITVVMACISVAAAALFFLAPSFRQGMNVALHTWHDGIDNGASEKKALLKLAESARRDHDAEVMAFVALRLYNDSESDQLAEEAVALNPELTWIYALAGVPYHSRADKWVPVLQAWDPKNAVPELVESQLILGRRCRENKFRDCGKIDLVKDDPRWLKVMSAAFGAEKYDPYLARRLDLDRAVMRRLHLHDPLLVFSANWFLGASSVGIYATSLLNSGKEFEAQGDPKQAAQNYSTVARFCQTVRLGAQTDIERYIIDKPEIESYQRLRSLAEKTGNRTESTLLAYEIERLQQQKLKIGETRQALRASQRLAAIVQASVLVMALSTGLLLVWGGSKAFRLLRSHSHRGRWSSAISAAGALGAFGLLLGALVFYVSYQPYAEFFTDFMADQGVGQYRNFYLALVSLLMLPGAMQRLWYSSVLGLYFWYAFIVVAILGLIFTVARRWGKGWRSHAAAAPPV